MNISSVLLISILLLLPLPASAQEGPCIITRITDGDTFHCESGGEDITVRLIGVDTPELPTPEGITAKSITEAHIPVGTVVRLELDPEDIYDNTIMGRIMLIHGRRYLYDDLKNKIG